MVAEWLLRGCPQRIQDTENAAAADHSRSEQLLRDARAEVDG